jgi:hypothetical protein
VQDGRNSQRNDQSCDQTSGKLVCEKEPETDAGRVGSDCLGDHGQTGTNPAVEAALKGCHVAVAQLL